MITKPTEYYQSFSTCCYQQEWHIGHEEAQGNASAVGNLYAGLLLGNMRHMNLEWATHKFKAKCSTCSNLVTFTISKVDKIQFHSLRTVFNGGIESCSSFF